MTENPARAVLLAPFRARTWRDLAFVVLAVPLGGLVGLYLLIGFGIGLSLTVLLVGVPLVALVLLGGRVWGRVYLTLAAALLGVAVPEPPPFTPKPGLFGFLAGAFGDRTSWRALLFLLLQVALGAVLGWNVLLAVGLAGMLALSPLIWLLTEPVNVDARGVEHRSFIQFGEFYVDSWPRVLLVGAVGVLCCLAAPWLLRVTALLHGLLVRGLLAPTGRDREVAELAAKRRAAVDDSTVTLRRLERDLHDGTQARLVTIAMALGRAEQRLHSGGDPSELVTAAHAGTKEALVELRELVRGIHPPALELGLEPALETLVARCAVPVELRCVLPVRPSPAIEAIAYFSVAELLTNVVKHSGAQAAEVRVRGDAERLTLTVRDEGRGGVLPPAVSEQPVGGLAGLAARARSVDGELTVASPDGGPTAVTVALPVAVPE
ncbi:sensor histidine kinase [Nocardia asteroides]|uniref:sensor histidine kinase n=1 Tax=Nocardia asteroides TaxID=1824 RepID=UPI001E301431|nr:sensor histidine kinase [Nocardia asteroides]UGT58983.1 sensor domain-containing protein [Nocardia asteroides]